MTSALSAGEVIAMKTIIFAALSVLSVTTAHAGDDARMAKVLDIEAQFKDQMHGKAGWKPLTNENKLELTKTAFLAGRNADEVADYVNAILRDDQTNNRIPGVRNAFACAEHGRLDPENAIDLARAAMLLNGRTVDGNVVGLRPQELASDFHKLCGQGEAVKLSWMTDEICAEIIKTSRLSQKYDFGAVLNAVKDMKGFESFRGVKWVRGKGFKWGVNGNVAVELVKASHMYDVPPEKVAEMFADVYGFGAEIDNEVAVELVKAALAGGSRDVKPAVESFFKIAGFYNLNRSVSQFISTTQASIAEMVKIAAAARVPVGDIYEQVRKVYGWGVYHALYGVTPENSMELVKLAYLDKPEVRKLVQVDHKYLAKPVDRGECQQFRAQIQRRELGRTRPKGTTPASGGGATPRTAN